MKELLELEAKNAISIEEEIENERKKVDAKTPITEEVGHPAGQHANTSMSPGYPSTEAWLG